jgi:CBS domain-containing protein
MDIDDLIRRPVHKLPPDATCQEAASLMRDENIGSVVVAEDGEPLGVVTDRDLVVRVIAAGESADKLCLRDVMSGEPIFLGDVRELDQVIATMREEGIRRMPIVDEEGQIEGLVSLDDLLLLLAEQLGSLAEVVRKEIESKG